MNVLFASSEVFPFSKTGGLADIASFLPKALNGIGHNVITVTPYYPSIAKYHNDLEYLGTKTVYFGLDNTKVNYYVLNEGSNQTIFVQNQHYFEREFYYGYDDDDIRFMVFSYSVLELVDLLKDIPQIIHVNDWQSAPVPFLLDRHYRYREKYQYIHTLLTIHNLQYQGSFGLYSSRLFNVDFDYTYVHFNSVNYLKTGIETASKINTVSPNYRNEIMTEKFGFTLDGALKNRENDLYGILNGIDLEVFNPETDSLIDKNYTSSNLKLGKQKNKEELLKEFNIEITKDQPLVSYIGRLAVQKGINLMKESLEDIINDSNAVFIFLGSGNEEYQNYFQSLRDKYPNRVAYYQGYNEELAHKIYASSDIFLMPSEFEPCGLGQMISMRYGTIPVVREVGGLKDTIDPYNKYNNTGTGFSFYDQNKDVFKDKVLEAINMFNNEPRKWSQLVRRALNEDFGLERMAKEYTDLYNKIIGGK